MREYTRECCNWKD